MLARMSADTTDGLRTPTTAEVPGLLRELEASGQSLAAFAKTRGLRSWKLYKARQRLRGSGSRRRRSLDLVPVTVVEPVVRSAPIDLVLASGHRLVLTHDFDEVLLRRLLGVMASC